MAEPFKLEDEKARIDLKLSADRKLEEYKATAALDLAKANARWAAFVASFRATIDYGLGALRGALILNGAAAIALLSFAGSKGSGSVTPSLIIGLSLFGLGALLSVLGHGFGFFAQSNFTFMPPEGSAGQRRGQLLSYALIGSTLLSVLSFCGGIGSAFYFFMPGK
jgi:hypothetical protein